MDRTENPSRATLFLMFAALSLMTAAGGRWPDYSDGSIGTDCFYALSAGEHMVGVAIS